MRLRAGTIFVAVALAACGSGDGSPVTTDGAGPRVGALTVGEAIRSEAAGPVMVAGYVFARDGAVTLCDGILESYPPQCGRPSIVVEGLDVEQVASLQRQGGLSWSEDRMSLRGELIDGVLEVTPGS